MNSYSDLTWRHLKQNKKRTILTIIGIVLAISLFSGIATFMFSMQQGLIDKKRKENGNWEFEYCNLNVDKVNKIKNNFEVKDCSIDTKMEELVLKDKKDKLITLKKCDYNSLNIVFKVENLEGRLPKNSSEIIVGKNIKRLLKKNIGDVITIGKKGEVKDYKIVGFDKDLVAGKYILAKTYLDSSKLKKGELYDVSVNLKEKKNKKEIAKKIGNILGATIEWEGSGDKNTQKSYVRCNQSLLQVMGQSVNKMFNVAINTMLAIVIGIIIVCTVAVIYNAFNISVAERINEFGILRSIGATPKKIRRLVFKEAFIMGSIAIPIGILAGYLGIYTTIYFLSKLKNFIFDSTLNIRFYPQIIVVSTILGIITILLSVLGPAISASRVSPIDAIKNSSNIKKEKYKRRRAYLIKIIFGIEGAVAYKNIRRNNKRFLITIFSLVISVVMFITFTSYINVFENTSQNIIEDINFHGAIFTQSKNARISNEFINELKGRKDLKEVGTIIDDESSLCIEEKFINEKYYEKMGKEKPKGVKIGDKRYLNICGAKYCAWDNIALNEAKKYIIDGKIDENSLNNGGVLLIDTNKNTNKANNKKIIDRVLNYKVGDEIKIPKIKNILDNNAVYNSSMMVNSKNIDKEVIDAINNNRFITVKVVGILSRDVFDLTSTGEQSSLIFSKNGFSKEFGDYSINKLVFKYKDKVARENIQGYLEERCKELSLNYMDVYSLTENMNNVNRQISIFIYGFITLITFIGIVNIINTITIGLLLRKSEFATMLSIGMSRKQLGKMIMLEGILHGIIASIIGSAISYGLFNMMLRAQSKYMDAHVKFPISIFIIACIGTIVITLIASLIPLRKIKNMSIVENIRAKE
ncbi:ABC transporter permease [Clostridium botulinum]|uniref:ABC transporter permease n=1 Tax=Clostridium botulinum TaxID=1491 RepID=A0A9Q1UWA1_CLOBO|nr:FtsX-like permease family protein [Clostridium botulinum]AEB74984.1 putative ABC transporter, permease protein [Clostridium botulinum BKT015925]KEI01785.1 ABC transporter permease [Clostridium botulinum C/D str. Sp77]KOA79954.1 ABC transporter permease [Clostridium botulinum]KOA82407.1 ABC transporter permease [Clostridium botulinum]KOA86044.1 ABC transporter permease [Clostridium botulinum]